MKYVLTNHVLPTLLVLAALASCLTSIASAAPTSSAQSVQLCVGSGHGCYSTIQSALDAAHDGDTIRIDKGTFAGGVTVRKSVRITGAGPGKTIIKGGGPVVTIGEAGAADADQLTVSIAGVTITGGLSTTAPSPDGPLTFVAIAGGVYIPGGPSGTVGATVTIRDSVITGNRASPTTTVDSGEPCPGGGDCPFAGAFGAGIADVGRLTLIDSVVSENVAGGPVASDAKGGGIWTATNGGPGSLTLIDSTVARNSATVSAPNGRFAEGGGIEVQDGEAFLIRDSVIGDNLASVSSSYPTGVEMFADSGGIHVGGFGSATIVGTRISGNTVSVDDPAGFPGAADSALAVGLSDFCPCGQTLVLKDSTIRDNRTIANVASSDNGPSGGAVEIDNQALVSNTRITDNSTVVTAHAGSAAAFGAVFAFDNEPQPIVVRDSVIKDNTVTASTSTGPAMVSGAVNNGGALELRGVEIAGNTARANGTSGFAQGGGIWNGQPFGPENSPPPQLTLVNTAVTRNTLQGSAGLLLQGGGLYTPGFPVTLTNSVIRNNTPDQCFGC